MVSQPVERAKRLLRREQNAYCGESKTPTIAKGMERAKRLLWREQTPYSRLGEGRLSRKRITWQGPIGR